MKQFPTPDNIIDLPKPTCKICKWKINGVCRRYPPQIVPVKMQKITVGNATMQLIGGTGIQSPSELYAVDSMATVSPQTSDDFYCGEFKAKNPLDT